MTYRSPALLFGTLLFASSIFASPVNINSANAEKIAQALSGIGIVKAQAIVTYRNKHGAFKNINDLISVKGIGSSTVNKNKKDILLK